MGQNSSASSTTGSSNLSSFFRSRAGSWASTSPPTSVFEGGARSQISTPRSPTFPHPPLSPTGGTLAIKAVHNNAIVMLRTPRTISFEELRKRIYDKFVVQEGVPLSESFSVAHIIPPPTDHTRSRSNSVSSTGTGVANATEMSFITSQTEWEQVVSGTHIMDKLTLRILDTPS